MTLHCFWTRDPLRRDAIERINFYRLSMCSSRSYFGAVFRLRKPDARDSIRTAFEWHSFGAWTSRRHRGHRPPNSRIQTNLIILCIGAFSNFSIYKSSALQATHPLSHRMCRCKLKLFFYLPHCKFDRREPPIVI